MTTHPMPARLAAHLRSGEVSRIVYGSIIGLALVLTFQSHPPAPAVVIGTLLATAVAVALAELYSEVVGSRARAGMGEQVEPFRHIAGEALAVAFGIAFPSIFFAAAALGWCEMETAFDLTKWTGLGLIGLYAFIASRLSGRGSSASAMHALVAAAIAGALIAFKALLH